MSGTIDDKVKSDRAAKPPPDMSSTETIAVHNAWKCNCGVASALPAARVHAPMRHDNLVPACAYHSLQHATVWQSRPRKRSP